MRLWGRLLLLAALLAAAGWIFWNVLMLRT